MSEQTIEIEADSLEEARKKLYTDDLIVLQESILCRGEVEAVEDFADTVEDAVIKAKSRIPAGAKIENTKVKITPNRVVLHIGEGNEENEAEEIRPKKAEVIEAVLLHKKGRKGFLGFGKTSNVYAVVVFQQAVVEVSFREKARLRATVRDYSAEELLQSIRKLELRHAYWTESLQLLNPKNDSEIRELLLKYQELNLPSGLDTIQNVCLENKEANWKLALKEAYRQAEIARAALDAEIKRQEEARIKAQIARARELKEQEKRLRNLDHKLAEDLMIYIDIYWTPDYSELKGIPRFDYPGPYRSPDPKEKQNIPRYSSDEKAFCRLLNQVESLVSLYLQVLEGEGLSEATASMEQKCLALLEAQRRRRKK